ncbi:MAG TPA: hypothetical protein PKH75_14065 [Bacillota bacterium]|mgnify:CR=1 FL=1|nr:hypothetical protein [Bacillota bacterium]
MGSEPCTWLVAFSAPATCRGKTGCVYTSYTVDGNKARALEEAAAFVGVCVDSGTFRED